jgi:hypothetical protein
MNDFEPNFENKPYIFGRPPKYKDDEERKKIKIEQTKASNKRRREEKRNFYAQILPEQIELIDLISRTKVLSPTQCNLIKKICYDQELETRYYNENQIRNLISLFESTLLELIEK